jgi:processing peptidase subunit beta
MKKKKVCLIYIKLCYCGENQVRIIDDDIPLAQFAVAFNGASWTDPDSIALMVMQAMLGSWNKSASGGKHMG